MRGSVDRSIRSLLGLSLALALPLGVVLGCARPAAPPEDPQPFVFRSLNLRQQDSEGRPAWELTSPEARYDLQRKVAKVRQPRGVVHVNGKPRYRIQATSGTVLNDGEVIQLEGQVRIQLVGPQPAVISGDRVRWTPGRALMEIDRRPLITDRSTRLSAGSARFLIDQDKVELRGPTRLVQPGIDLRVSRADWFPATGVLTAGGPVVGTRTESDAGQTKRVQTLTASGLEGNTRNEVVEALAPVRFTDPSRKAVLNTRRLRWNVKDKTLSTSEPFDGVLDKLEVEGDALVIQLASTTVTIPSGCRVRQPGERLRARACRWNWRTQAIEARGGVQINQDANEGVTRSELLNGKLGRDGQADFTTPGGRVQSQLKVPPPSDRPRQPAPVTF